MIVYLIRMIDDKLRSSSQVGEYVAVRAMIDGAETTRFYSPCNRSDEPGPIDFLMKGLIGCYTRGGCVAWTPFHFNKPAGADRHYGRCYDPPRGQLTAGRHLGF